MEFNSAPADPCSNTRRDNVWSEATSSESVEMLLKSVGKEEMMPAASIILATSVCKDQGGSAGHVESGIDLDTRNSDTMGPKDEVHEDPTQNKPLDDQLPLVEVSSLNSESAGLSFGNPHNLTHNTLSGRSGISAIEGEHEPSDENVQEPKTIGCSKMAVLGASEALLQKNADVSLIICNVSGHESHASTQAGIEDTVVLDGNTRKSSVDISDTPCFESRVENSVDTVAANLDCPKPDDSGSIPSNKECELLFPEGDVKTSPSASLQTDDLEVRTLATSSDIGSTLNGIQDGSIDGSNQHSPEPGYFVEHCTIPDGKGDSLSEDVQTSQPSSRTLCETPLLTVETNKDFTKRTDRISNTDISKSSNPDLSSSDAENHQTTEVKEFANDSAFTQQGLGVHLAGDICVSSQVIEENLPHAQAEFSAPGEVICVTSEQGGKRPVSPRNMDSENVETLTTHLETQSVGEEEVVKGNDGLHNLQGQPSDIMEETDELAPHAEIKVFIAVDDRPEDGKEKLSVIGFPISDTISGQDGVTKNPDTHLISRAASVLDVKADGNSGSSPLSEVAASSPKSVKKCNEMSSNKSPSPLRITCMDLDKQVNDIGCKKSNLMGSCDADIGRGSKHEITPVKSGGDHESAQPADTAGERSNLASLGVLLTSNLQEMNVSRPSQPFFNLKRLADLVLTSIGADIDREMAVAEELLTSFGAAIDREVAESGTAIDIEVAEAVAESIGATIDREVAEALAGERLALEKHLVASSQAVAMAIVDVIDREIVDRFRLPSPIKLSKPGVTLRPPPWTPKELQGDYLFVVTHVKAYLRDEARQVEFLNHMRRIFNVNMTLQDALDMFVVHGFWPDEENCTRPRPILQEHFNAWKMLEFKRNKADYERFLKSWCSLSNISKDGSESLVKHEFNTHGIYGPLRQENYMMSCIYWHEQIATRSRLSLIAEEECAGIMEIKKIKYYRLSMKAIHDSLDRLGVPQRDIIIIHDELGIDIILSFRYRLDCTMRYVFNLVGPNPTGYTDAYVYF